MTESQQEPMVHEDEDEEADEETDDALDHITGEFQQPAQGCKKSMSYCGRLSVLGCASFRLATLQQ